MIIWKKLISTLYIVTSHGTEDQDIKDKENKKIQRTDYSKKPKIF